MAITTRALAFATRWFDPAIVHRTFEPLIADWQREWSDSPRSRRAWVSVRGFVAFVCAAIVSSPSIVMTPIPRTITVPVVKRIAIFCTVVAVVLGLRFARVFHGRLLDATWTETWLLRVLPATLMMAFPFSMVLAVDTIHRGDELASRVKRSAVLKLALVASLFALIAEGVVVPFAHELWLHVSTPEGWNVPEPTPQDLSTLALLLSGDDALAREIRSTLIARTVATVMPVLLIWLRWTMLEQWGRRRYWPASSGLMTTVTVAGFVAAHFAGVVAENTLRWRPGNGLWLPIVVFGAWALLQDRRAGRVDVQEA